MFPLEVRYKNNEKLGMCVAFVNESSDEVESVLRVSGIEFTEITDIRPSEYFGFKKVNDNNNKD